MGFIESLGLQAGTTAVGALSGMLLGNYNDRRQLEQQRKLQELQMQGNRDMMQYSMQQQYDMWKKTGPVGMMAELEKAGLNTGLMYGMSGAGGGSLGSPSGNVGAGQAPTGGREIQEMTGMALQNAMLKAQVENIKSQTEKNKADAEATKGVQTDVGRAQIESILQGITESKAKTAGQNITNSILALDEKLKGASLDDAIDIIKWTAGKAFRELQIMDDNQYVSHTTRNARADTINGELMTQLLNQTLLRANIVKTTGEIRKIEREISNMIQENMREWDKMSQKNQEILIEKILKDHQITMDNDVVRTLLGAIPGIIIPLGGKARPAPVQGFGRGNN